MVNWRDKTMNQNCENFKDRIADSLSGNLEKEQEQQLLDHVKGCSECTAFEIALKDEDELLSRLFAGLQAGFRKAAG